MKVVNTYHVPFPAQNEVNGATFLAVLTEDEVGSRAVYVGIVKLDSSATLESYTNQRDNAAEWIAHGGQKLNYRGALPYFPDIEESEYRV